jgi:hypothetical protein
VSPTITSSCRPHRQTLSFITYLLIYGAEPFLRSCQLRNPSGTSQHFMEPEGSIPCSQESSTGPYPEPYQSNPLHPIPLRSILISSTHLRLGLPSDFFPSGMPTNILYAFLFSPIRATCTELYYTQRKGKACRKIHTGFSRFVQMTPECYK